ncbi:MAG: glycoside hydrolase family 3 N-terminal domain-containing protein [Ferruginibacter sp.]
MLSLLPAGVERKLLNRDEVSVQDTVAKSSVQVRSLTRQFYEPDSLLNAKTDSVYNKMTVQERAAQMIMSASSPKLGLSYTRVKNSLKNNQAANVLFLKGSLAAFIVQKEELDQVHADSNRLPALYACDCEPSLLHKKWADVKAVKAASQTGSPEEAGAVAEKINEVMKPLRIGLNFAPVVDVGGNKAIIGNRSYGTNKKNIVNFSSSFVQATQYGNVAATIKHFPGHGAVRGDTHKQAVFIDGPLTELDNFKNVIDSSSPVAILVGHITVKNNKAYGTAGLPSTLSSVIIKKLLREELGFSGLVVTDAMNMGAVSRIAGADYKAAVAGNDIIVMPLNAKALHAKIVKALQKHDELSVQFEQSIKRVIRLKLIQLK